MCYTIIKGIVQVLVKEVIPLEITHESLIGSFEQKQKLVSQFNLIHDDFFAVVMQDKPALETTLRTLLKKKDLIVTEVRIQYSIRNLVSHSVILDVLAEDSTGKLYNIEVQVKNEDDYQKRSRYNQANIDTTFLRKGKDYSELPEVYIIFITSFDIFKRNDVCYKIDRVLSGYGEVVDNGVHEYYFYTKANDGSEIAKLLHYFEHTDVNNSDFGALSDAVKLYKTTEEGVSHVCDEVRKYGDDRAECAKAQEQVRAITSLIKRKGLSLEEALDMYGITMKEYAADLTLLNMQQSA